MSVFYGSGSVRQRLTQLDELVSSSRINQIQLPTMWGISGLRDTTSTTGTGAAVAEANGEAVLSTGTQTSGVAQLQSLESGLYVPGAELECGVGIRVPSAPTSSQDLMWGYFDNMVTDGNGVGFGVDSTNEYVFYRIEGVTTKVYQNNWNVDKLDGTGTSGYTLNYAHGLFCQAVCSLDHYGTIQWFINVTDSTNNKKVRVEVHRVISVGLVDLNLPVSARAINGGAVSTNIDLVVGSREVIVNGGPVTPRFRTIADFISEYTVVAADGVWEPVLAIRRKSLHGTSDRYNTVTALLKSLEIQTDNPIEYKLSFGDTTSASNDAVTSITRSGSVATVTTTAPHGYFDFDYVLIAGANQSEYNGTFQIDVTGASTFTYTVTGTPATPATGTITSTKTWGVPYEVSTTESAVQVRKAVFTSTIGTVVKRGIGVASKIVGGEIPERESIPLGSQKELVLWVRRTTATATIITAILTWIERW